MNILVTGGLGYIGSHTVVELIQAGFKVIIVDNLVNASKDTLKSLKKITEQSIPFYQVDILDKQALRKIFKKFNIDAVVHFAALKAVGESVQQPLRYYHNNVSGSLCLFEVMQAFGVRRCVFSSSASVYGLLTQLPILEDAPLMPINPYGMSKVMVERILADLVNSLAWSVVNLRYFNPAGAHASGFLGENPLGIPNNLLPFICQTAAKKLPILKVFGNDYPTPDGTGIRDYIHVVDLARAHVLALKKVCQDSGVKTYNLGTGQGYSVLEIIETFKRVNQVDVPYEFVARRLGDPPINYADVTLALRELNWKAEFTLEDMVRDAWCWQKQNL